MLGVWPAEIDQRRSCWRLAAYKDSLSAAAAYQELCYADPYEAACLFASGSGCCLL